MRLKCKQNTTAVKEQVLKAFRARYGVRKIDGFYEHGQWWINDRRNGAQWSVCDAEGYGSTNGFCFEQVTNGDDD